MQALAAAIDAIIVPPGEADDPRWRTVVVHAPPEAPRVPTRVGLALDPWPGMADWAREQALDAVVLHRHWKLDLSTWPGDVGVLATHDGFDRRFGFGDNPELQSELAPHGVIRLASRGGHPLGTVGTGDAATASAWRARVTRIFGGVERELPAGAPTDAAARRAIARVAIARAMTPELVQEAAAAGAELYVTGQLRAPAVESAGRCGLHVIAVGHHRAERWGLSVMAVLLRARLPALTLHVA